MRAKQCRLFWSDVNSRLPESFFIHNCSTANNEKAVATKRRMSKQFYLFTARLASFPLLYESTAINQAEGVSENEMELSHFRH